MDELLRGPVRTKEPRTQDGATYRLGTLLGGTLNTSRKRGRSGTFLREVVGGGGGKTRAHLRPFLLPKTLDLVTRKVAAFPIEDIFRLL